MVGARRLCEATDDAVEAALADSYLDAGLAASEPAALLECWNRTLDQFAGLPDD